MVCQKWLKKYSVTDTLVIILKTFDKFVRF